MAVMEEERVKRCKAEVDAILVRYGCLLDAQVLIRNGAAPQIFVRVVPNPKVLVPPPMFEGGKG